MFEVFERPARPDALSGTLQRWIAIRCFTFCALRVFNRCTRLPNQADLGTPASGGALPRMGAMTLESPDGGSSVSVARRLLKLTRCAAWDAGGAAMLVSM